MGNPVTDARVRKLWNQRQLARAAGVSLDTITRAEKGERLLPLTQARLAQALGRERAELFPEREEVAS